MRLLLQRHDHQGCRAFVKNSATERSANPFRDERPFVPLWDLSANHEGYSARLTDDSGGEQMTSVPTGTAFPRRDFLKGGGALIIGFSLCGAAFGQEGVDLVALATGPDQPDLKQLDTWLAIHADNTATIFLGYVELGQGSSTALLQIAAEELDLDISQVKSARLDTNRSPNQGATAASAAIARGGPRVRSAAAQARQVLLTIAAKKFKTPADRLVVSNGIVSVLDNPQQSVTYGQLVGDKPLHVPFTGAAPLKPVSAYKLVGTRFPRTDLPD